MVESKIKFEKVMKKPSEIMEIEDAIRHAERIVNECEVVSRDMSVPTYRRVMDKKCGDEHRQLANWLKELRELWDKYNELLDVYVDSRKTKCERLAEEARTVYCGECKYVGYDATMYLVCNRKGMGLKPYHVYHDDYCSYGEYKEDGE